MSQSLRVTLLGHPLEDERVVVGDHRGAGAGGADDVIPALLLKDVQEMTGDVTSLSEKARVEGRLATAGLAIWVDHLDAESPQDPYHADAYLGIYKVHVTRNEQGHPHLAHPFLSLKLVQV